MTFSVAKRNTGNYFERPYMGAPYMLSGGPNWELQANVILAGTTVLVEDLIGKNLRKRQSQKRTHNLVLGF